MKENGALLLAEYRGNPPHRSRIPLTLRGILVKVLGCCYCCRAEEEQEDDFDALANLSVENGANHKQRVLITLRRLALDSSVTGNQFFILFHMYQEVAAAEDINEDVASVLRHGVHFVRDLQCKNKHPTLL